MLSFSIHEYRISLHSFRFSLISFINASWSFQHASLIHVLLDLSLSISLSDFKWYYLLNFVFLLSVYRSIIEFCVFLVYPMTIALEPCDLAGLTFFLKDFLDFLHKQSCHPQTLTVFLLCFQSVCLLFPALC